MTFQFPLKKIKTFTPNHPNLSHQLPTHWLNRITQFRLSICNCPLETRPGTAYRFGQTLARQRPFQALAAVALIAALEGLAPAFDAGSRSPLGPKNSSLLIFPWPVQKPDIPRKGWPHYKRNFVKYILSEAPEGVPWLKRSSTRHINARSLG